MAWFSWRRHGQSPFLRLGAVALCLSLLNGCSLPQSFTAAPNPENTSDAAATSDWLGKGMEKNEKEDYQGAIADFQRALDLNPDDIDAYYNRAFAYIQLGRWQDAISDLTAALRLDPSWVAARVNRGNVYLELGNYQEAMADYSQALAAEPTDALAHHNLGLVLWKLGKVEKAFSEFQEALELAPDYAQAYFNRGLLHAEVNEKKEALADFEQAASLFQAQGNEEGYKEVLTRTRQLRKGG